MFEFIRKGCERFFRTMYNGHLINEWLPALDGVVAKLERMDPKDQNHRDLILAQLPLSVARFDELVAEFPPGPRDPDREARFQHHAAALRSRLNASVA